MLFGNVHAFTAIASKELPRNAQNKYGHRIPRTGNFEQILLHSVLYGHLSPQICQWNSAAIKLNCRGQINWWPFCRSTQLHHHCWWRRRRFKSHSMHLHYSSFLLLPRYSPRSCAISVCLDGWGKRRRDDPSVGQDNAQWPLTVAGSGMQTVVVQTFFCSPCLHFSQTTHRVLLLAREESLMSSFPPNAKNNLRGLFTLFDCSLSRPKAPFGTANAYPGLDHSPMTSATHCFWWFMIYMPRIGSVDGP